MNSYKVSKRKWLFIGLPLLAVLLYPFQTTVVPTQHVLVLTDDMRPVQGALVRQCWQHYPLEREGHEKDLRTDANGRVSFARRTIRASLIARALGPMLNIFAQGVHASFGIHTYILMLGDGTPIDGKLVAPQPGEIVYRVRS